MSVHQHHHHHHRHDPVTRFRRRVRRYKKTLLAGFVLVLLVTAAVTVLVLRRQREQRSQKVSAVHDYDMKDGYRTIFWNGKEYRYNSLITTVLYAGVDSEGEMKTSGRFLNAPNADSISLVVLDKKRSRMSVIAISRDTMTEVQRYTLFGQKSDSHLTHLGYAFAYGDGGETSCENLKQAVSELLEIPVNEYVITNRSSIPGVNGLVGGVTVIVPNDDLARLYPDKYPDIKAGTELVLDESNVADYIRARDTGEDFSNRGRMERQKTYITAYIQKIRSMLPGKANELWEKTENMSSFLRTSITRNHYLEYANLVGGIDYTEADYYILPGEDRLGEEHDEFYPDREAVKELVISLFYEPLN